jgi:hypothetical protein
MSKDKLESNNETKVNEDDYLTLRVKILKDSPHKFFDIKIDDLISIKPQ